MTDSILKLENLSIGYQQPVCTGINAAVQQGELVGLAGKNGSGKSTLLKTILGLQPTLNGKIFINGKDSRALNPQQNAKEIAVVFSRLSRTPAISVFDLVALGRLPYSNGFSKLKPDEKMKIDEILELVGISALKNRFATQLSDGQLQMVMIARALVQETRLILMDEPSSHLDIENQFKIFELIYKLSKETGKTFVIASHQVELLLQNASRLWWMDNGNFFAGFPEEVALRQEIFEKLSQNQIKFDYLEGHFKFFHPKNKSLYLANDGSALAYWTIHALERNGFEISKKSADYLQIQNGRLVMDNRIFNSIEELIHFLNGV